MFGLKLVGLGVLVLVVVSFAKMHYAAVTTPLPECEAKLQKTYRSGLIIARLSDKRTHQLKPEDEKWIDDRVERLMTLAREHGHLETSAACLMAISKAHLINESVNKY